VGVQDDGRRGNRLRRWIKGGLLAAALSFVIGTLVLRGLLAGMEASLPEVLSVEDYRATAKQVSRVYGRDGVVIGEFFEERRTVVPGDRIPTVMKQAAVAAEDGGFYEHEGLDYLGIVRAMWVNLRDGRFSQGASTITQQVARSFYLTQEKSLKRKLREALLAMHLERHLSKGEILELYLNQIYFGHGRYGVAEAARFSLGKRVAELDPADAALLMAIVPAPVRLNPFVAPVRATQNRDRILERMEGQGFIDAKDRRRSQGRIVPLAQRDAFDPAPTRWFVDVVRRRLKEIVGLERLKTAGLQVFTTLDSEAQDAVNAALVEHLGTAGASPQAAVIMMSARTREVLAITGGKDFQRSSFNRAVQARRQAGSIFKPFVYGAGFAHKRFGPSTTYPNKIVSYRGASGPWRPKNSNGKHDGAQVTVSDALRRSLNVVAVQALRDVGVAKMTDFARRAGVRSAIPSNLTSALGSAEVTPFEMANAYATLADDGGYSDTVVIRRVEDSAGRVVHAERGERRQAIDRAVARQLTELLKDAVRDGTGRQAQVRGVGIAGKTGTTNQRGDAWFVGYTTGPARIVASVWVGHDDGRSIHGTGGSAAAPIFASAMSGFVLEEEEPEPASP
jgi:penicillin-binding protein 1A